MKKIFTRFCKSVVKIKLAKGGKDGKSYLQQSK